jgi:hypothetical protein
LSGRKLAAKQESYSWLFVDTVPLLYKEKNIERQNKVETWLDLYQLTKELNLREANLLNAMEVFKCFIFFVKP